MKKFACDICLTEVEDEYELSEVDEDIRVLDVKDVCKSCRDEIRMAYQKMLSVMRKQHRKAVKGILNKMLARLQGRGDKE